jgi:hypothetical protein
MLLCDPLRLFRHGSVGVVPDGEILAHAALVALTACIERNGCFEKCPPEGLVPWVKKSVKNYLSHLEAPPDREESQ